MARIQANLSELIASMLEQGSSADPTAVAEVLKATDRALTSLQDEATIAQARLVSPSTPESEIGPLSADVQALDVRLKRLLVARDRLDNQHQVSVKRKAEEEREDRKQRIIRQRDRVAAQLAENYPRLAQELASLLADVAAVSDRCKGLNIPGPEAVSRHLAPQDIVTLVRTVHLPPFDAAQHKLGHSLWPPIKPHTPMISPDRLAAAEKAGAEIRATSRAADEMKRQEAASPTRRVPA